MKLFKNVNIKKNSIEVVKKYPFVLPCFYIVGILLVLLNHIDNMDEDIVLKIVICIGLFAANSLIFNALRKQYTKFSKKVYTIALAVSALACFGYYFTIEPEMYFTLVRTAVIFFAQALIFISIPFLSEDRKTEHFVNLIVGRLIITMAMFFVAFGGISGILFALEELFYVNIPNELYADVPIVLMTTFVPMVWLFGIRYDIEPKTTKLYRTLLVYVCMTLLIAYTAVVYGYFLKIVFNGFKMPSSIICNLVVWYSLVGMAVYYLSRSYTKDGYGKFFAKWYPRASVIPLIIMFISLFMRVNQYGFTINRLYMLLGGIYLALMTLYILYSQAMKKELRFIAIPLVMAIIALISIIEPISVNTLALKSQHNQLREIISKYDTSDNLDVKKMTDEDVVRSQDIIHYISNATETVYPRTYENITILSADDTKALMNEFRQIEEDYYYNDDGWRYESVRNDIGYIEIQGYTYAANFYTQVYDLEIGNVVITTETDDETDEKDYYAYGGNIVVKIIEDDKTVEEVTLSDVYADNLAEKGDTFGDSMDDFVVISESGNVKFIMENIDYMVSETGEISINYLNGYVLVK